MLLRYLQEERDVEECADPVAIARSIEAAINERFPFGAADKQYEANARKLVFSMKQNQVSTKLKRIFVFKFISYRSLDIFSVAITGKSFAGRDASRKRGVDV